MVLTVCVVGYTGVAGVVYCAGMHGLRMLRLSSHTMVCCGMNSVVSYVDVGVAVPDNGGVGVVAGVRGADCCVDVGIDAIVVDFAGDNSVVTC